jgi:hypothetical protein
MFRFEITAVELLHSGDLLRRLTLQALMQVAAIVNPPDLAELVARVRMEPGSFLPHGMRQQDFGGETGSRDSGFFEKLPAL